MSGKSSTVVRALGFLFRRTADKRSRMNREIHVRICESLRGQFPRATRPAVHARRAARPSEAGLERLDRARGGAEEGVVADERSERRVERIAGGIARVVPR